ncbi:Gfo/Idh/MocA family protein [Desulfobacter vibrioformis]|uniref:Gfo/Idh/MocA family protein n=1 Tax=Desulfobacter vibrioformis TaxID=34031 RepID=UPI00054F0982|nr:Gfo/Idh/MocA family oxidoreductase [Desulfobacter vibrioformis]
MICVAQIGCGYWGPNLLRNLVANSQCRVKSLCDLAAERRKYVSGLYPAIDVTDDCQSVLADPEIDAVVIATPVFTHYDLAMRALGQGKHILVEKPMAGTVEEVEHIRDLAREKGLIAMVGHTFLYNPAVRFLKKLVSSGQLGNIRYIYSQRLNLGRIRSDVDVLWNLGPHDISIIQYLLDDVSPLAVQRQGMDYIQKGIEDTVFLNILYPGKVMAHVHVSWLDPQKVRRMTVVGEKKMVVYDDMAENKIAIFDKGIDRMAVLGENMDYDTHAFPTFTHRSGDLIMPRVNFQEPLKVEIQHFMDCIRGDAACLTDANHALGVVNILNTNTHIRKMIP